MTIIGWRAVGCCALAVAFVASCACVASAAVRVELVDRGTPTGGTQPGTVPPDYRGKVVRVISDEPILAIDAASSFGPRLDQNFGFFGDLLHFEVATQPYQYRTTPLEAADNSTPGLLNFDSHFLPLPAGATYTVAPYEVTSSDFNIFRKGFPETSTEFQQMRIGQGVGGGDSTPVKDAGRLSAAIVFGRDSQAYEVNIAYLFLGPFTAVPSTATIPYRLGIETPSARRIFSGRFSVPEPTSLGVLCSAFLFARRSRGKRRSVVVETLDSLVPLSVSAPTNVSANFYHDDSLVGITPTLITWSAVNGASGYHIERSSNQTDWSNVDTVGSNTLQRPDTTNNSGKKFFFHVIAFDATSQATSAAVAPITGQDLITPITIDADASSGVSLSWPIDPLARPDPSDLTTTSTYRLFRSAAGQTIPNDLTPNISTNAAGTQATITDPSAVAGTRYKYVVQTYFPGARGI